MIYIIGDSHVSIFSGVDTGNLMYDGQIHMQPEFGHCYTLSKGKLMPIICPFIKNLPDFTAIKVGSHTAYNSFNKLPKIDQAIYEYEIGDNDYIFISFGQIDVQYHLLKNSIKNNTQIDNEINLCLDRYIKTLLHLKEKYKNIKIGAYAPPATSIGCGKNPKIKKEESILYNRITLSFNDYLKVKCEENGILFKEISSRILNSDGTTNNQFVIDDIHLSINVIPFILDEFSDII